MASEARKGGSFEVTLMWASTAVTVVMTAAAVVIAVISDSTALLLDGLYSLIDIVVSLVAIYVLKKIYEPPNENYHYGYAKYEPFLTALQGVLIISVCLAGIISGAQDIMHPDPVRRVHVALAFAFISFVVCMGMGVYMRICARRLKSKILEADSTLAIVEGMISGSVFAAFGAGFLLGPLHHPEYMNYADPVICIVLSLALIVKPIRIVRESVLDLVDASPAAHVQEEVKGLIHRCREKCGIERVSWIKMRKAGRRVFANVCFALDHRMSVGETEAIEKTVVEEMKKASGDVDVSVQFMGKERGAP